MNHAIPGLGIPADFKRLPCPPAGQLALRASAPVRCRSSAGRRARRQPMSLGRALRAMRAMPRSPRPSILRAVAWRTPSVIVPNAMPSRRSACQRARGCRPRPSGGTHRQGRVHRMPHIRRRGQPCPGLVARKPGLRQIIPVPLHRGQRNGRADAQGSTPVRFWPKRTGQRPGFR
jgi:hypothetical protein